MKFGSPMEIPILAYQTPDQGFATARVTYPFAWRSDGFHGALDIGNGREGDALLAVQDGTVIAVGNLKLPWSDPTTRFPSGNYGGLMTVVEHYPKVVSIYAHQRLVTVKAGDKVRKGQKIGEIGSTGSASVGGAHVHFGIQAPAELVPPGLGTRPTPLGYGLDVDPWPLITGQLELLVEEGFINMKLREKYEEWTVAADAVFYTDGPGVGDPKKFAVQTLVRSVAESLDGVWRVLRYNGELLWITRRPGLTPKVQGGDAQYDSTVKAAIERRLVDGSNEIATLKARIEKKNQVFDTIASECPRLAQSGKDI